MPQQQEQQYCLAFYTTCALPVEQACHQSWLFILHLLLNFIQHEQIAFINQVFNFTQLKVSYIAMGYVFT